VTYALSHNMTPHCYYFFTETQTKHWLEKSEMVRFLEEVGSRNRTAFNRAVIRECGVVIGFLQRPIDEVVTLG